MGAVFRAKDLKLDRIVAVKTLIRADMTNEEFVRFQREAKVASNINHRNVVKIYDFGIDKSNKPYLIMEFISGQTLRRWFLRNPNPDSSLILNILNQIASGVAAVHKAGIVHRDLKPSNVLISKGDDGKLIARLLDFGAARDTGSDTQALTQYGVVIGTPKYLSPEQAQGVELDERADIYSLGCIAYELFCGRPPFEGETGLETIELQINAAPLPLGDTGASVTKNVEALVMKMIEKNPDNRLPSMVAVIEDIDRISETVDAPAPNVVLDESPRGKKIVIAVVVLVLLVGLSVTGLILSRTDFGTDSASLKKKPLSTKSQESNGGSQSSSETHSDSQNNATESLAVNPFVMDTSFDASMMDPQKGMSIKSFLYIKPSDSALLDDCAKSQLTIPAVFVDGIEISDRDVGNIVILEPQWLLISRSGLTDRQLQMLAKCHSIESLKIYKNPGIAKDTFKSLQSNPNLKVLSVRDCDITDGYMSYFTKLKNLRSLDLEYNKQLTRKALMKVADIPHIELVSIFGTGMNVKASEVEALKKKLHLQALFINTTFSSPRATAQIDAYRYSSIEGMRSGPIVHDLRKLYESSFRTN